MSVPPVSAPVRYVAQDGRLTKDGLILLEEMRKEIQRLAAIVDAL